MEQLLLDLTSRIAKLERGMEALRATEQRGFRGCRVRNSSNQTLTSGLVTTVNFDTEIFDYGDLHDNVTNNQRITVASDAEGFWFVMTTLRWSYPTATAASDYIEGYIQQNGNSIAQLTLLPNPVAGGTVGMTLATVVSAAAADYFTVVVANATAGSIDIVSLSPLSAFFMAVRIQT